MKLRPVRPALQNFFITANGDVELGGVFPLPRVGNIRESTARDIWFGGRALAARHRALGNPVLQLDSARRSMTLAERVRLGWMLMRR